MSEPSAPENDTFWDLAYRHGDHLLHWEPLEVPLELVDAVESGLVRRGQTALDIGCGAGCEALYLASQGIAVIGVDASGVALDVARRQAEEANVIVDWRAGDATHLPLADNSVDFALDRGCLHVIARRRRRLYAREVARVLRPGGALLLRGAREDDEEMGLVGLGRREIERLFVSHGFECGPLSSLTMSARCGALQGVKVVLTLRT